MATRRRDPSLRVNDPSCPMTSPFQSMLPIRASATQSGRGSNRCQSFLPRYLIFI